MRIDEHEKTLADMQQNLARAWVAGDRAFIERVIAPDWTATGPTDVRLRFTDVFVRGAGQWQAVASQAGLLQ